MNLNLTPYIHRIFWSPLLWLNLLFFVFFSLLFFNPYWETWYSRLTDHTPRIGFLFITCKLHTAFSFWFCSFNFLLTVSRVASSPMMQQHLPNSLRGTWYIHSGCPLLGTERLHLQCSPFSGPAEQSPRSLGQQLQLTSSRDRTAASPDVFLQRASMFSSHAQLCPPMVWEACEEDKRPDAEKKHSLGSHPQQNPKVTRPGGWVVVLRGAYMFRRCR